MPCAPASASGASSPSTTCCSTCTSGCRPPAVTSLRAALRRRFPAALIDEFQDTDPLQFSIFDTVYGRGEGLLFLVGDPKQAIYSFRNADLHTYLQARPRAQAEYTLAENQRSTPALLEGLNALFGANPRAFMLERLDYHPVHAGKKPRKPFVDHSAPRAALHLWSLPLDARDGEPPLKAEAKDAVVQACVGEIARLLAGAQRGEVTHDGQPLQAGDIAVLVRSHAEGSLMRQALALVGVGSVELAQTSVFASTDAQELERILVAILEPGREPLLRAALATELLGCDAQDVESLSSDAAAVLRPMARFSDYRGTWLQHGIGPMLRQLTAGEGIARRMLLRPDGERRLTNLRHLSECLHEAAREHPGPEAQLRWLQRRRREDQGAEATQVRLESDRNLVQIVTIHKSKGLEYPVVFCPFLWDGSAGGGRGGSMPREYHDDHGRPTIDYRPGDDQDIRRRIQLERDAERLRLDLRGADARGAPLLPGGRLVPREVGARLLHVRMHRQSVELAGRRRGDRPRRLARRQDAAAAHRRCLEHAWPASPRRTRCWNRCRTTSPCR